MRMLRSFFRWLAPCAAAVALPLLCNGGDEPEMLVLQYHFIGATPLAQNTNAASATKAFALKSTVTFANLALNRLAMSLGESLHFGTNAKTNLLLLRPLLDDLLLSESMASVWGVSDRPLDFVLAVHLDTNRTQLWQQNLKAINHGPGEELRVETFSGWQWNRGETNSFWMVPAQDWLVVGNGERLASVRSDYLQQIQKSGRPAPALEANCFEADVDWPRLSNWVPLSDCPLKLGRTQAVICPENGNLRMTCHVTYPQAIEWQPHPMHIPTNLVREPLTSFVTGQNVEPFLKSDETRLRYGLTPFSDQFYFWSMGEIAFQSYAVWPDKNPRNTMAALSTNAMDELNPKLQEIDKTQLIWRPKKRELVWMKLPLITPGMLPVPTNDGQFIAAALFSRTPGKGPVPPALWKQFQDRTNLVYYDWELTGPRLKHLLTLTQVLPILQMLGMGPRELDANDKSPAAQAVQYRLDVQEKWLAGLTLYLGNTITEVTKTGPNELTVIRNSPFVFNSLELIVLSHLLTDTPAGPLDWQLLPQAKMSGPGMPSQ